MVVSHDTDDSSQTRAILLLNLNSLVTCLFLFFSGQGFSVALAVMELAV